MANPVFNTDGIAHQIHGDHYKYSKLVRKVRDCIEGQQAIRDKNDDYLPYTSGMASKIASSNTLLQNAGKAQYAAYRDRARFPDLVQRTENGILGIAFETAPQNENIPFDKVARNGRTIDALAKSQLREVLETGRGVLLVDAPQGGGDPYIVEYKAENFINFAVDDEDDSKFIAVKLKEYYYDTDDVYHEYCKIRYREYRLIEGVVTINVSDEQGKSLGKEYTIPLDYIPLFVAGSVDNLPYYDPVPLLPVADASISIYQISADYRQYMHGHWQGTPYATGISEDEWELIMNMGLGVGSFLYTQASADEGAAFGMLETTSGNDEAFRNAIKDEMQIAENYAVQISQDRQGVEAAESIKMRAATKHATIYTILESVSNNMTRAVKAMMEWSGQAGEPIYKLNTDFSSTEASAQLITALTGAINAEILPQSVLRDVVRAGGHTERTDDEMDAEILDGGGTIVDDN